MSDTTPAGIPEDAEIHDQKTQDAEDSGSYVDSELDEGQGGESDQVEGEYTDTDLDGPGTGTLP